MGWIGVTVSGLSELEGELSEDQVAIPLVVRKTVVEGAKPVKAAIKTAASTMFAGQSKQLPGGLVSGIRYKASRGTAGMSYMVGPFGKGTAHRALVSYGHEIIGHLPNKVDTGKRTKAVPFVAAGIRASEDQATGKVTAAIAAALDATL